MAAFLRFLRQPSRPSAPRPLPNNGNAAGSGVVELAEFTKSYVTSTSPTALVDSVAPILPPPPMIVIPVSVDKFALNVPGPVYWFRSVVITAKVAGPRVRDAENGTDAPAARVKVCWGVFAKTSIVGTRKFDGAPVPGENVKSSLNDTLNVCAEVLLLVRVPVELMLPPTVNFTSTRVSVKPGDAVETHLSMGMAALVRSVCPVKVFTSLHVPAPRTDPPPMQASAAFAKVGAPTLSANPSATADTEPNSFKYELGILPPTHSQA
jgi:hypothetical protein